ncbi:putative exporter [Inhella inkyongensis]|uniref:Putative exporter n=1 Tax=Inhella inkyongensis TaxID=392593 RepID=A0A840S3F8_9BURK|nr:hypothetical protein [Inhella inkyongensis]MBB5205767.1 putative exporter [Inhella inkyongensis]
MADLRASAAALRAAWPAWIWAASLLLLALALAWAAGNGRLRLNTDVLAMLPKDERRPEVEQALQGLARAGEGRLVVLVQAGDGGQAADRFATAFAAAEPQARLRHRVSEAEAGAWFDLFAAQRGALVSEAQRQQLSAGPTAALGQQVLQGLLQPMGLPRVGAWGQDPLNTLGSWLAERAQSSRVRVQQGRLSVQAEDGEWALLMIDSEGSAFALAYNQALADALAQARAAAAPARVLAAGVPLHAHAAATTAQREMHVIGLGSLLGVFVLSWLAFARLRPRLLVLLSVGSGLLVAAALTTWVFGELHLITLVFGASLVGVAENYASSYYAARINTAPAARFEVMRAQLPTMALALATTLAGYGLLAATPFPGLQQVALFSAAGLLAALVSTWLWFPHLDRGAVPERPLTQALARGWARWPAPRAKRLVGWLLPLVLLVGLGLTRLQANDDIRLLQSTPPALLTDQIEINRRLDLPSPAQFYLLSAASAESLLVAEEALKARLQPLVAQGLLGGWQAVSDWVPSAARQAGDFALVQSRWAALAPSLSEALGQAPPPAYASAPSPLRVQDWLAAPVSESARHQWIGEQANGRWQSVLLLRGVQPAALPALAALGQGDALRWVDKVADVSELLARQRERMLALLGVAVLAVAALLVWRFGRSGWRALLPTVLAGALTLTQLSLLGQPLQLFHVLALLLLLGVGVDYGIFLLAQPQRRDGRSFVAVTLAAASTWLAFGLLAFSATPALQAFGWTLGWGVALSWVLTPFFIPDPDAA